MEDSMKHKALYLVLALGLLPAQQATAQSNIGLHAIGASAAFVSPENLDGAFGLGVFADLGQVAPKLGLEPTIEYWSRTDSQLGVDNTLRDVSVGVRGKYYFDAANPKVRPFAGAGLGMHFLHAESTANIPGFGTVTATGDDTKLGLDLGGGLSTPLNAKNDFRAEAWYGIVSDVNQFAVRVGISHKINL
jgi:opacity protein-like surface antigen